MGETESKKLGQAINLQSLISPPVTSLARLYFLRVHYLSNKARYWGPIVQACAYEGQFSFKAPQTENIAINRLWQAFTDLLKQEKRSEKNLAEN